MSYCPISSNTSTGPTLRESGRAGLGLALTVAAAIVELLGDPTARRRLGNAARAVIAQRWGWEGPARSFTELYQEMVQTSRQRTR